MFKKWLEIIEIAELFHMPDPNPTKLPGFVLDAHSKLFQNV